MAARGRTPTTRTPGRTSLARYNADGSLDTTFGVGGPEGNGRALTDFGRNEDATAVVVLSSGKILIAGTSYSYNGFTPSDYDIILARYNADGTLDNGFSPGGVEGSGRTILNYGADSIRDLAIQPSGKIDLIPSQYTFGTGLIQLDGFGAFDTTFGGGDGIVLPTATGNTLDAFNQVMLLANGQFLVAGTADTRNEDFALTRLNADGSKDATFGNAGQTFTDFGSSTWDRGWAIAKNSDGRIIVGGSSDRKFALVAYRGAVPSNVLRIDGTTANDTISVGQSGTTLSISVNGAVRTASTAGLSKIYLYGLDGDDTLSVAKSVTIDAVLVGGRGFDRLHAGSGRDQLFGGDGTDAADYSDVTVANYVSLDNVANDGPARNQNVHSDVEIVLGGSGADTLIGSNNYNVLVGNGGNDILTGNAGRDVLIGGAGKDTLSGGADVDLLIASRTTFDASLPTLRTLSFEWREPTRSYATRIVRLRAGVLGAKIDATTIPNDSIADTLTGGSGQDWFVKHSGDVLSDKAAEETATQF